MAAAVHGAMRDSTGSRVKPFSGCNLRLAGGCLSCARPHKSRERSASIEPIEGRFEIHTSLDAQVVLTSRDGGNTYFGNILSYYVLQAYFVLHFCITKCLLINYIANQRPGFRLVRFT